MISFENAQSFGAKGDFIRATGLRGLAVWEAAGDAGNVLIDAICKSRSSLIAFRCLSIFR